VDNKDTAVSGRKQRLGSGGSRRSFAGYLRNQHVMQSAVKHLAHAMRFIQLIYSLNKNASLRSA
jgi:hypothetical protein